MPRNVEAKVGEIEQVYLRDIDDLQQVVDQNKAQLDAEVAKARAILTEGVADYAKFCKSATASTTIHEIRANAQTIADQELQRALAKLSHLPSEDQKQVQILVHRLLGKILHSPSERLRHASAEGNTRETLELARMLFGLDPLPPDEADPNKPKKS